MIRCWVWAELGKFSTGPNIGAVRPMESPADGGCCRHRSHPSSGGDSRSGPHPTASDAVHPRSFTLLPQCTTRNKEKSMNFERTYTQKIQIFDPLCYVAALEQNHTVHMPRKASSHEGLTASYPLFLVCLRLSLTMCPECSFLSQVCRLCEEVFLLLRHSEISLVSTPRFNTT